MAVTLMKVLSDLRLLLLTLQSSEESPTHPEISTPAIASPAPAPALLTQTPMRQQASASSFEAEATPFRLPRSEKASSAVKISNLLNTTGPAGGKRRFKTVALTSIFDDDTEEEEEDVFYGPHRDQSSAGDDDQQNQPDELALSFQQLLRMILPENEAKNLVSSTIKSSLENLSIRRVNQVSHFAFQYVV